MKKILAIILALSCAFVMFACDEDPAVCETCVDEDKNCVCDVCEKAIECKDADTDGKCDNCGKDVAGAPACTEHKDENTDDRCDVCGANLVTGGCRAHFDKDKDLKCDTCGADIECTVHIDVDKNGKCDVCEAVVECTVHIDVVKDAKCDVCGADVACTAHVDVDKNGKCDVCKADVPVICFNHVDEDKNNECDICQTVINAANGEVKKDYLIDAKPFIDALNAGSSYVEVTVLKGELISMFATQYAEDGSYAMAFAYPVISEDINGEDYTYVYGELAFDKDGNCVAGDEELAANVGAKGLEADLESDKIVDYQVSKNALSINVKAEDTADVIGVELASDATVVVVIDDAGVITSISLVYVDAEGDNVQIICSYAQ